MAEVPVDDGGARPPSGTHPSRSGADRRERQQNNEDPAVYAAFRQHVIAIGAPDPGEEPISDAHFA